MSLKRRASTLGRTESTKRTRTVSDEVAHRNVKLSKTETRIAKVKEKSHVAKDSSEHSGSDDENSHFVRSESVLFTHFENYLPGVHFAGANHCPYS